MSDNPSTTTRSPRRINTRHHTEAAVCMTEAELDQALNDFEPSLKQTITNKLLLWQQTNNALAKGATKVAL